ncbi:hypothetical protein F9C07_797 [Aspergillus flavus]|uniref:Uncharacterized protein n=1 Tax=Aspergillus flavus (strain ATCC 200026 / FGSC A1120 / IAM 13836 / NRRL 3357 / JCM 12722 / SRRC 167) TaxID=332952 RepID=A0A7U2MQU3_ASPFN|nr:hypothetical protein F9C07_797 [Aspergillus flavus]
MDTLPCLPRPFTCLFYAKKIKSRPTTHRGIFARGLVSFSVDTVIHHHGRQLKA